MKIYRTNESDEYYFQEGCYILEHLNDTYDPDVSIARARVSSGKTTRKHSLANTVERYIIQKGKGLVEIEGEAAEVSVGDVVVIPAGFSQRIKNTGDEDLIFLAICSPRFRLENYQDREG